MAPFMSQMWRGVTEGSAARFVSWVVSEQSHCPREVGGGTGGGSSEVCMCVCLCVLGVSGPCFFASYTAAANGRPCRYSLPPAAAAPAPARKEAGN